MLEILRTGNGFVSWIALVGALSFYVFTVKVLDNVARPSDKEQLSVAIPPMVQVALAGGDRYLAANFAVFRAMVVGTDKLDQETYEVLGRVQVDATHLNPAHEDNYYISQAILPWNGEIEADMEIQQAATDSRPWDAMPPFFLGFDKFYFLKDPAGGAENVRIAAERSPTGNREILLAMAARWYERGDDPRVAIGMIKAMAESTRDKELKKHLQLRILRLQGLALLRDTAKVFVEKNGHPPKQLDELIGPGLLANLPKDPLGQGYLLDSKGMPTVARPSPAKR
jgi:hypothetical protein